jgi:hypothetical protein
MLGSFSNAKVTKANDITGRVHVKGFVTSYDLRDLVKRYDVFLHSEGVLCVSE